MPTPQILDTVPGPSPWYLRNAPPFPTSSHGPLTWRDIAGDRCVGKVALSDRRGNAYLVVDFQTYFMALPNGRAILWSTDALANMRFSIVEPDRFEIINATDACHELKSSGRRVMFRGGEVSSMTVPTSLPDGPNEVVFPPDFTTLPELLVLVHSTANGVSDFFQSMHLCIWSVQPSANRIDVYRQDWFNRGAYDFGYQWITRVARDPDTQRVVGEGERLRSFQLDASMQNVEQWL